MYKCADKYDVSLALGIMKQRVKNCRCGLEPKQSRGVGVERHLVMLGALDLEKMDVCLAYLDPSISTRCLYPGRDS